jgi:hypothetical protein
VTLLYDSSTPYDSPTVYEGAVTTLGNIFTPPLVKVVPPFLPDSTQAQTDLWRHYENRYRGVNVWIMSDNSVVQSDPTPENSNTNMSGVFPWNPNDPAGPYVTTVSIQPGANPQIPTVTTTSHNPYPVAYFAGASSYIVTPAQSALLAGYTAHGIGYADCLSPGS